MTIAVDFDGTIVEHAYPAIGKEIPDAIRTLKYLQSMGHKIILWTVREGTLLEDAVAYCRGKGLEFYSVNENYFDEPHSDSSRACRKLTADLYIDDRNVGGFPGWSAIYEMVARPISAVDYYYEIFHTHEDGYRKGVLSRLRRIF